MVFWPSIDFGDIPAAIGKAVTAASEVQTETTDLVLATAEAISEAAFYGVWTDINNSERGVAYATGNGDYAEWIPRMNPKEDIRAGQIVAVHRGAISLRTDRFDHLLVVSSAPAVLGKMPEEARTDDYEKVAFLGQVPVEIIGTVASGDYILPSGDHDGFGIAVHPEDIRPDQIPHIVGVAWEDGTDEFLNLVNVAVGLREKAQENAALQAFESELDEVAKRIALLKSKLQPTAAEPVATETAYVPAPSSTGTTPTKATSPRPSVTPAVLSPTFGQADPEPTPFTLSGSAPAQGKPDKAATEDERIDLVNSYFEHFASSVEGLATVEDLTQFALQNADEASRAPYATAQTAIDAFSQRVWEAQFSEASIQEIVRTSLLNRPEHPLFAGIQPGTQAETQLIRSIQTTIFDSLKSTDLR
jgi:hypothetical protein